MESFSYVCNKEGKIIGEYYLNVGSGRWIARRYGSPPYSCRSMMDAIDVIEQVHKEGA